MLEIQGVTGIADDALAQVAPWLRLAFALCTIVAGVGTWLASPILLWALVPIAALAAVFTVHPFDLVYNYGIRYVVHGPVLPKRGPPSRFACGLGAAWLSLTAVAFAHGADIVGYTLGGVLTLTGLLVSTTDICIPSLVYRTIFGFPPRSSGG